MTEVTDKLVYNVELSSYSGVRRIPENHFLKYF